MYAARKDRRPARRPERHPEYVTVLTRYQDPRPRTCPALTRAVDQGYASDFDLATQRLFLGYLGLGLQLYLRRVNAPSCLSFDASPKLPA
jgi:hypothetical protein